MADMKCETGEEQVLYPRQSFENWAGERATGTELKYWNREQEAGGFAVSTFEFEGPARAILRLTNK